jgi:catechol 2,3-dioxygenase-like lactoylglutathione lyase family enzyme
MMAGIELKEVCALLSVWDMPTTVRFYCHLLGFEIEHRSPTYAVENGVELFHWCMLKAGDHTRIMLNGEYDEGERPAVRPAKGDERFGVWFFYGCPDVDGAYEKLKAAGVDCEAPKIVPYGFRVLSFRDPDGHGITLQWPAQKASVN